MPLRYAGNCTTCGVRVEQKTMAWYDPVTKVTCTSCRPVEQQLGADLGGASADAPVLAPPAVPVRSARTDLEKGTELEQRISEAFTAAGYRVQTNVVREDRNGARHEIDVLAEKTDQLLTLSVAVECKAWNSPIEKDVITKFDYVRRQLGLGHGVVVSLNGARPGALAAAADLGVVVWGPDEIEPILGRATVTGIQNRPMVQEVGFPRLLTAEAAQALVAGETRGRLGIGKEEVVWTADAWLPVAVVQLTLMEMRLFGKSRAATSQAWAVYDLLAGTFVTRLDDEPPRDPVNLDGGQITPRLKVKDPAKRLDDVIARYDTVTSDDAKAKYRSQLADLGVPDMHTATTGNSSPFLYPVHLAIARQKGGAERVIAVDAFRSRIDADLGLEMSKSISWIRESLGV